MRRFLAFLVMGVVLPLFSGNRPALAASEPFPRVQIKLASHAPEADLTSRQIKFWADMVTRRTAGRITFQYFWGGSLLNIAQQLDGVRDDLTDIGYVASAAISGKVPEVAVLEVPFAFPLDDVNMIRFQDEVNAVLDGIFQRYQQKLIFNPSITADPVSCKSKFLDSARAWNGALVRTAGRWQSETLKAWGANPTQINIGDLYTGMQRGTVDCTLLVYNLLESFRIHEVAKYITRIDHSINYTAVTINSSLWNKLGPETQKVFIEAGREAEKKGLEFRKDATVSTIEKFKKAGVQFCTPSQAELKRLRDATNQVWEQIRKAQGEAGHRIMAIAAKYRDKVVTGPVEGDRSPCPGAK